MLYSEHPTFLMARRHLNSVILTNFENLSFVKFHFKHFPRNFLVLTDPLITCIYLRPTSRRFRDQENVHYSTSNLICSNLLNTFATLLCGFLLLVKHLLFNYLTILDDKLQIFWIHHNKSVFNTFKTSNYKIVF